MYIQSWIIILVVILFFYLIYKVSKNSEKIHGLQYDLNNLEVEVGVINGEEWALNSDTHKQKQEKEKQAYYDGKMDDGEYDGMLGIDRRKRDGKNPKLGTLVD